MCVFVCVQMYNNITHSEEETINILITNLCEQRVYFLSVNKGPTSNQSALRVGKYATFIPNSTAVLKEASPFPSYVNSNIGY